MNILFLTEYFPQQDGGQISGGAESRTYYLAKQLSSTHHISVITARLPNSAPYDKWDKLKIYRVGPTYSYTQTGKFLNRFLFFLAAVKKALELNFETIDANSVPTYLAAWIIGLVKNKKTVFWIPDVVGFKQAVKHFGLVTGIIEGAFELLSIYLFRADKTIALSETTKNKLVRLEFIKDDIAVIYPGI